MNAAPATVAITCTACRHTIAHRADDGTVTIGGRQRPVVLTAGRASVTCWHEVYDGKGPWQHSAWRVCGAVNVVEA